MRRHALRSVVATLALVRFASSQDAECLDCPHGQQPVDGGSSCGACPDECKMCMSGGSWDGGVSVVDGVCQDFCSAGGYCGDADVYKAGGTDCTTCAASSSGKSSRNSSLTIIIPVVIAAVLLVAAVLYLVRKRRVAAATPDEAPQLDTEVQVEA